MRICYVAHSDAHFTGPYVDYFSSQGHEVHVVSLVHRDLQNAIMHYPLKRGFDPMKASWSYLLTIPRVTSAIRAVKADIVQAHYLTSNCVLAAIAGVHPLVATARGSDVNYSLSHPIKRRLILYAMKHADLVNTVSRDLEKSILKLGVPAEKVFCLTLGIEPERFFNVKRKRRIGPVRIICTRVLRQLYQCELIVRAAAILAERKVPFELTFAGPGPEQGRLQQEVAKHNLMDRITFLGGCRFSDLPLLLAEAEIYVSASLSDGTSLSLLEAMASGIFPVVSDIPANRAWLSEGNGALFFDVNSHEQLADCLMRAIQDEQLRRSAIEINRHRVLQGGDRKTNMEKLARQYEKLVKNYR